MTPKATDGASGLVQFLQAAESSEGSLAAKHERLTEALRASLRHGFLRPGGAIPGERELSDALGLSRATVRRAIKTLVDERMLVQRPGARTSVAQRVEKPVSVFVGFSQDMQARGLTPGTVWIDRELASALPAEALALALSPGSPVCRLKRLRTADGSPMALECSVVPTRFLPDPGLVEGSLYAALEQQGTVPVRALQRMRATVASALEAEQLGVRPGAPLLDMERRCFNEADQPVEFCRSLYRGDLYDLLVELSR
jgi:GntR family transcriptional regulator